MKLYVIYLLDYESGILQNFFHLQKLLHPTPSHKSAHMEELVLYLSQADRE